MVISNRVKQATNNFSLVLSITSLLVLCFGYDILAMWGWVVVNICLAVVANTLSLKERIAYFGFPLLLICIYFVLEFAKV